MLTKKQHEIRIKGITGSEVAAVLGVSSFARPIDIWRIKRGYQTPEVTETGPMRRGRLLEPAILDWYAEETGYELRYRGRNQKTFTSKRHPLVIATPDAIVYQDTNGRRMAYIAVDAKAPGRFTGDHWGEPETDAVRPEYILQAHWEMEATGLRRHVDIPVYLADEWRLYRVEWNQRLFDIAYAKASEWWERHVVADVSPDFDDSESTRDWLLSLYPAPANADRELVDGSKHRELVDAYAIARDRAEAATAEKKRLEHELMSIIGDAYGMETHRGRIVWPACQGRVKIDWKGVVDALGGASKEVIDANTTQGKSYRQFRPKLKAANDE